MKRKLLLLTLLSGIFFTACKKEEETTDTTETTTTPVATAKYYFRGTLNGKAVELNHNKLTAPASTYYGASYGDFSYLSYWTGGAISNLMGLAADPQTNQFKIGVYREYGISCENFENDFAEGETHNWIFTTDWETGFNKGMLLHYSDSEGTAWYSSPDEDGETQSSDVYCNITSSKPSTDILVGGILIVTIEFKCDVFDDDGNKGILEGTYHGPVIECP